MATCKPPQINNKSLSNRKWEHACPNICARMLGSQGETFGDQISNVKGNIFFNFPDLFIWIVRVTLAFVDSVLYGRITDKLNVGLDPSPQTPYSARRLSCGICSRRSTPHRLTAAYICGEGEWNRTWITHDTVNTYICSQTWIK